MANLRAPAYAGVLLMLIFAVDASVRLWRRGNRRRAVIVGGSLIFFILAAGVHCALIERGLIRSPYWISWFYLAILIAMSVLDLHMPGVTGFDVLARLAETRARVPVVVITGNDSPESETSALGSGASAYLRKPVRDCLLLDTISAAIARAASSAPK